MLTQEIVERIKARMGDVCKDYPCFVGLDLIEVDPNDKYPVYFEVLLANEVGCVVMGNYYLPDEWRKCDCNPQGEAIYELPWDKLEYFVKTQAEVDIHYRAAADDDKLRSYM